MESAPFTIHPETHIGHIHFRVSNVERALRFYNGLLGFEINGKPTEEAAYLTVRGARSYLIALSKAGEQREATEKHAGLYHFAILLPDRRSLGGIFRHLMQHIDESNLEGAADHGVSEALYLQDPDGIGIEIYRDRPRTELSWKDGQIGMTTKRLDEEGLLRESKGEWRGMPEGTSIGHIHLHVSNLEEARKFYADALGLKRTCAYPGAYFYAADDYHHHVAANTWLGEGIQPASKTQPGLDHFSIVLPDTEALHHLLRHLSMQAVITEKSPEDFSHSIYVYDPDGVKIQFYIK